ncbi:hypothetical protein D6C95_02771 [Aureobasidium pullulans]|nr:hypothetical protein D6C95_02771 [Aureobasidium pullulans]
MFHTFPATKTSDEGAKPGRPSASRRITTSNACGSCRRRKIRCDGAVPCGQCKWTACLYWFAIFSETVIGVYYQV